MNANAQLQTAINRYVNEKLQKMNRALSSQAANPTPAGQARVEAAEQQTAQAFQAARSVGVTPQLSANTQAAFNRLVQQLAALNSKEAYNAYSTNLGSSNNYKTVAQNKQLLNNLRQKIGKKTQNIRGYTNALTRLNQIQTESQLNSFLNSLGDPNWGKNKALANAFTRARNTKASTLQS